MSEETEDSRAVAGTSRRQVRVRVAARRSGHMWARRGGQVWGLLQPRSPGPRVFDHVCLGDLRLVVVPIMARVPRGVLPSCHVLTLVWSSRASACLELARSRVALPVRERWRGHARGSMPWSLLSPCYVLCGLLNSSHVGELLLPSQFESCVGSLFGSTMSHMCMRESFELCPTVRDVRRIDLWNVFILI